MRIVSICATVAIILVGCAREQVAATRQADPVATLTEITAIPTAADKALAAQYRQLTAQVKDMPAAREQLRWNPQAVKHILAALDGTRPATQEDLDGCRAWTADRLYVLKNAKLWKAPPAFEVTHSQGPIAIDGKLDDDAWKTAPTMATWYPLNELKPLGQDAPKTTMQLLWDDKYLYFGFTCEDRDLDLTVVPRDGFVFKHDCIELFIQPSARWNIYWELELAPSGSILDALLYKMPNQYGGYGRYDEEIRGMQYKITFTGSAGKPTGYVVELAVPLDELPGFKQPPKAGQEFRMLACRINSDKDGKNDKQFTCVPVMTWFHNMECYATARLLP